MIERDQNQEEEEMMIFEKDTRNKITIFKDQDQEAFQKTFHIVLDPKEGPLQGATGKIIPEEKYFLLHLLRHKRQLQKCSPGLYFHQ